MLQILGCITIDHDLRLVVLAGVLCMFASFTAMEALARARSAAGRAQLLWTLGTGTVAGCGVWSTHFVAMLAYKSSLPITYDVSLTVGSILTAVIVATAGIQVALRHSAVVGGAVLGFAVGAMHYMGMGALRGPVEMSWDIGYVGASLIIGPALGAAALAVAMRGRELGRTVLAAGLFTLGIVGLHFTGMTALTLTPIAAAAPVGAMEPMSLALAVAAIALMIIGFGFVGTFVDAHLAQRAVAEADRLRAHIAELEATKRDLEATSSNLLKALAAAAASSQSKSQFLAAMSHELRTPLNAIIGYSELMRMELYGPLGDARYADYMGDIHKSGSHLLSLINDILDLARLDASRVELDDEDIDIRELIDETTRAVAPQAREAGLRVESDLPPLVPRVRADRRRVKQILLNLLSNAVKFTPDGGQVRVFIAWSHDGFEISVADTGIGMRPEDIPLALDRFGQVDNTLARQYEGTGLGLPLVKQLIELHGGGLRIESALGAGTTVTVAFPGDRVLGPAHAVATTAEFAAVAVNAA
jgi:signal transduction histidine kinase